MSSLSLQQEQSRNFQSPSERCEHCSFSGTPEELQVHLRDCHYVLVECPFGCNTSIMRLLLEMHKATCGHRIVCCKRPGCTEEFMKKDELEHDNNFAAHHLDLLESLTNSRHRELKEKLKRVQEDLECVQEKLKHVQKEHGEEKKKSAAQSADLQKKIDSLTEEIKDLKMKLSKYEPEESLSLSFNIKRCSFEDSRLKPWMSPPMSTRSGHKFSFEVKGIAASTHSAIDGIVSLFAMRGEQDEQLKWPVSGCFTLTLIGYKGGDNKKISEYVSWKRPVETSQFVQKFPSDSSSPFIIHSKLPFFLNEEQLHFKLVVVIDD